MLFHIVGVSVQQKLKALTKFEIYENSKKIPKKSGKMRKKCEKNREKILKVARIFDIFSKLKQT